MFSRDSFLWRLREIEELALQRRGEVELRVFPKEMKMASLVGGPRGIAMRVSAIGASFL